jgi:hypothetical protein
MIASTAPRVLQSTGESKIQCEWWSFTAFKFADESTFLTRHIRRLTAELNCPMPTVDIAHQRMITARSIHQEQKLAGTHKWDIIDWSALIAGSRVAAGMDPFDCNKVRFLSRNVLSP